MKRGFFLLFIICSLLILSCGEVVVLDVGVGMEEKLNSEDLGKISLVYLVVELGVFFF